MGGRGGGHSQRLDHPGGKAQARQQPNADWVEVEVIFEKGKDGEAAEAEQALNQVHNGNGDQL